MLDEQSKIKSPRAHKGRVMTMPRDAVTLRWIGEQYAVRLDQVQQLLGRDPQKKTNQPGLLHSKTAWRVLKRWEKAGFVASRSVLAGQPVWVWLTAKGLDEFGLAYKPLVPKVGTIDHLYWTNHVRLFCEKNYPDDRWVSERTLRLAQPPRKGSRPHVVDGELVRRDPQGELTIAIEVELTPKKPEVVAAIVRQLAHTYVGIWYFTRPSAHESVVRAISQLPQGKEKFFVKPLDEIV